MVSTPMRTPALRMAGAMVIGAIGAKPAMPETSDSMEI